MFGHLTVGTVSARARTRIATAESQARPIASTIVIGTALVTVTSLRTGRIAAHSVRTAAQTQTVGGHMAFGARRARIRRANTAHRFATPNVRIANETIRTAAVFAAAGDHALRIRTARTGRTQRRVHNRRSALAERVANERLLALAHRLTRRIADGADAARRRIARVARLHAAANRIR